MKKNKVFRKAMSLLLSLAILVGTLAIAIPQLKVLVSAIAAGEETITQERVVSDYETTYSNYASYYLNGAGEATDMVIPGLHADQDYVVQGISYYPAKDWMVVTAYHNTGEDETAKSSKMFCLDAKTGEFVAMFSFINVDGTVNTDHGGGIAFSENNIYYSCGDQDRKIAYAPLSALDGLEKGGYMEIQLAGEAEFYEVGSVTSDSKTAYTAYVCYDQGYLWMGNFYDLGAKLAGITIAAADYNVPATSNYNSMVYGYKLKGSTPAEEWSNLISGTADCKGSPTHALAINNTLNDIQYAVVDNGKLYLSRSYGSGAGNSVNFGFGETSKLTVADIDLSATPKTNVTISTSADNGTTKTIKAHVINEYEEYNMMPMSEGLCFVNGQIFCTFEGASNKYMNESGDPDALLSTDIGNCQKPVDVIWKIDPYALENRVEVVDTPATHYEKVNSLSEIENGEEYLIVYESPVEDPVTQQNILYAIDANGGYKDYRLSKNSEGAGIGYTGAIGHAITEYSIEDGKLYLGNAEKDDAKNLRWEITNLSGNSYSIQSPDYYFVNQPNFYCDASTISMATDTVRGTNMKIQESGNGEGGFWISNNDYYLWCNDGTTASYNTAYNNYYTSNSSIAMYSGVTEQAGTFHTDALNVSGSNVLGGAVVTGAESYYSHGVFNIYKRVIDKSSSTYESRVYTDMTAELQADGTYTIDLETYAISPNHYEFVGERPTDYIFVMDASTSVTDSQDGTGIVSYNGNLQIASLCAESVTSDDNGNGVVGYAFAEKQIYYQTADGNYHRLYLAINNVEDCDGFVQHYWLYYIGDDGLYYVLLATNENNDVAGGVRAGVDKTTFYSNVDGATGYSGYSSQSTNTNRRKTNIFEGPHHEFFPGSTGTPLETTKAKMAELVDQIAAQNSDNRIAVTYYGASASYLAPNGWASSGFTDAFWNASSGASTLKAQISNITSPGAQTDNSGMEFAFANSIVDNSGVDYTADGTRNLAIIFISDGVPGADDNGSTTTAANNAIAKALTIKNKGAFIYSVIVGKDDSSFDKNTFMSAVSSRYPAAEGMTETELGGRNVDGVEYFSTLAECSIEGYTDFAAINGRELVKNDSVGLANLDAGSILCEELSTAFKGIVDENGNLAEGITVSYKLVPGSYDKVERFSFDESSAVDGSSTGVKLSYDASNSHKLTISGYDYSEEYISKNKTGRKLQIRIEGVEANEEADITNTSINNTASTAIYQNDSEYSSADTFKYFPTEYFNIPTYTYVLDYDLPMYDSDVNGTLVSVDGGLNKQETYKTDRETDNVALNFVNDNLDMTYELLSGSYTNEENRSFCLIQRDDGTYDWFRINIVPASNVLYEESRFEASSAGALKKSKWTNDGSPVATYQTLSGEDDRYGYDSNYANNGAGYSNGTALKATVNSGTKRSETMTFSYSGTGFDLMSVCGANTGVQVVNVKRADGTIEMVYMVDTYYVDTENYNGAVLNQVPIVNHTNADGYGDYTVEVTAAYLSTAQGVTGGRGGKLNKAYTAQDLLKDMGIPASKVEYVWFNDNSVLNGGTGPVGDADASSRAVAAASDVELECYIDGIRVYNPLGDDNSLYIDSEKGAKYYNILNELAADDSDVITGEGNLFAYVVGALSADEEGNIPTLSFGNYQSVGPQNEIYLQSATGADDSHAVAFNVALPNADSRVMVSLRAVDGVTTAKVASSDSAIEFAINTATEQYFDITPYLDIDTSTGMANVIITNSGSGLLSVNNLKLVDASAVAVASEDLPVMARSLSLRARTVDPNSYDYDGVSDEIITDNTQQPEVDTPVDDNTEVEVPVVVENIFTKIIAFFKKLIGFIFSI